MKLPTIGMGTFGSDRYDGKVVADAVRAAIDLGYKMFDCASVYGNEKEIGGIFAEAFLSGKLKRDETVILSKVWNDMHGEGRVIESCLQTCKDLQTDYLDVYFMHWPFPNYHAKGCSVDSRNPDSKPFFVDDFMAAWRQMEWLKKNGYAREIALSNMTVAKFEAVLPLCEIKPYAHEMELHPTFQQRELYDFCKQNGIEIVGYCPLGSPNRPERDRTPEDIADTKMPEIAAIADTHGVSTVAVCLAWAIARGHTPIPFASKRENLASNFAAAATLKLTAAEMEILSGLERNNRLVKGQVFLWDGAEDWRDLWDEDGTLAEWSLSQGKWIKKAVEKA